MPCLVDCVGDIPDASAIKDILPFAQFEDSPELAVRQWEAVSMRPPAEQHQAATS
jgi:hypothetical protein